MKFEIKKAIRDRGEGGFQDFLLIVDGKIVLQSTSESEAVCRLKEIIDQIAISHSESLAKHS